MNIKRNENSTHPTGKAGFSSPNFDKERQREMARLGGKRSRLNGLGGFSSFSIEERKRIAKMGSKASHSGHMRKKPENPFDVR